MNTGPVVTSAAIARASAVLQEGRFPSAPAAANLDEIDTVVDTLSFISERLPDRFFGWIADALHQFDDVLTDLTGDAAAIRTHAKHLRTQGLAVKANAEAVLGSSGRTPGWVGGAGDGYRLTTRNTGRCAHATARVLDSLGIIHLEIGNRTATIKTEVIKAVRALARRLVRDALAAMGHLGLEVVGGVVELSGGVLKGAAKGALFGPVGALVGGVKGAFDKKDEIAKRIKQAFTNFVSAAGDAVADALDAVFTFIEESLDPINGLIGDLRSGGNRAERAASLLTTGKDPGPATDAPGKGSPADRAKGKNPQDQDLDIAKLNQPIGDGDAELPPGWHRATPAELKRLGLTPNMMTDENGFKAEVFVDKHGKTVVAFGGTGAGDADDPDGPGAGMGPDAAEDAAGAATVSPQTKQALAIANAIEKSPDSDKVIYSGHSLGGRHAATAALASGNPAVTYNAAGVSSSTTQYIAHSNNTTPEELTSRANDGQIRRYTTSNDPLTNAQQNWDATERIPDAVGHQIKLGNTPYSILDPISGHALDEVVTNMPQNK